MPRRPVNITFLEHFYRLLLTSLALIGILGTSNLASADPEPGALTFSATAAPSPISFVVIGHVGEADQQISLEDANLLAHRRTTDPFGIAMSGKFKGIPLLVEQPTVAPSPTPNPAGQLTKPSEVLNAPDELTLEQAVQQLSIGAVNVADREALIGLRSVHEGDLLVLELHGRQFVVWVQSIDRRGVRFCDIYLQRQTLKPFRFGPIDLPGDSAGGKTVVRDFLK